MNGHFKNTCILIGLGVLNLLYFISMWIVVWVKGDYQKSFSWGLENFWELKCAYWVWYGIYVIVCFTVLYLVYRLDIYTTAARILNTLSVEKCKDFIGLTENEIIEILLKTPVHIDDELLKIDHVETAFTIIYYIATLLKLSALPGIAVYDMSTSDMSHYTSASIAFAAGILCDFCLLIRRWLRYLILGKEHKIKTNGFMDRIVTIPQYRRYLWWICIFTTIWVSLEITFALLFLADTSMGFYEFWLTLLLVSIYFWQIADFWVSRNLLNITHQF
jgi:hypothetical protein